MKVVNGINKNMIMSGARLLPVTVLDYPVARLSLFLLYPNFVVSLNEFTLGLGSIGIFISWYLEKNIVVLIYIIVCLVIFWY